MKRTGLVWAWLCVLMCGVGSVDAEDALLPPALAFPASIERVSRDAVVVSIDVVAGYALYRDRIKLELVDSAGHLVSVDVPHGVLKHDPGIGDHEVFERGVDIALAIADTGSGPVQIRLGVQGCAPARGVCFNPFARVLEAPGVR